MPNWDFKTDKAEKNGHPLIRLLDVQEHKADFAIAKVEIDRPRAALGFAPARLVVQFFNNENRIYDYKIEPWDAELNDALLDRKIRAADESNEIQRFGLGLNAALQHPESRYGDGFFSAVLMIVVDQSPLANMDSVRKVRPYISTNSPSEGSQSVEDCSLMIQEALQDKWIQLRRNLGYDEANAKSILAGALAYYLDDRFSITDGRKLGWLKAQ